MIDKLFKSWAILCWHATVIRTFIAVALKWSTRTMSRQVSNRQFTRNNLNNLKFYQVLYVDYGNQDTINIDGLFEWDPVCNTFPFQAILCRLANIHCVPAISEQTLYTFIHSKYLNQPCKAIVM